MKEMVEYLFKDADVRSSVYVAVVKESAEEMLKMEYPDKENTSSYINNLFHPRQYTFFNPFTTIHEFVYDETDPLRDTIAPYVELKDEVIHIEGLAMFSDGKMETIFTKQEGKIIQILRGREKLSVFAITLDDEEKEKDIGKLGDLQKFPFPMLLRVVLGAAEWVKDFMAIAPFYFQCFFPGVVPFHNFNMG
jgi:spore germination protein